MAEGLLVCGKRALKACTGFLTFNTESTTDTSINYDLATQPTN